jgi:16S rRNA processing protein RimM
VSQRSFGPLDVSGSVSDTVGPGRNADQARFLVVGRVIGPVGLSGESRAQLLTDFPERFDGLERIHVGDNLRPFHIEWARVEGDFVILKLVGVDDAEAARALRGKDLSIPVEQAVELPPDSYYWHQIVGMDVWSDDGRQLGSVSEVLRTGSNDVYVVSHGGKELLIPAIEDVILQVDVARRRMLVHLLPGMEQ